MFLSRLDVQGFRASAISPLSCEFTGRFSLVLGANGAGKTTLSEAIALAHRHRFPRGGPLDAAALGQPPRAVSVEYSFHADGEPEGALGDALRRSGWSAPSWSRALERSLGKVRTGPVVDATEGHDNIRLVYLPALRNPVDELSRRDAQVLLELLRAEQIRNPRGGGLAGLRAQAEGMLSSLSAHQLVADVQGRIATNLRTLTSGVHEHHAFVGTQTVDDAYLARVFELLLATLPDPSQARRLEASSLGYVNLLHIAVTLAGIPDPSDAMSPDASDADLRSAVLAPESPARTVPAEAAPLAPVAADDESDEARHARERLRDASSRATDDEDTFFPQLFHATVLIEEPEAHLHPQLQHGLIRYLRSVAHERRDLQIILTTHSGELAAACEPDELVVVRKNRKGAVVARNVSRLPVTDVEKADLFQQTRLHLDASRSGALFADSVVVVEGVSESVVIRSLGRVWAYRNPAKESFIDALSIVPVGRKVGEWPIRLLATSGYELVDKVAVLSDTDLRGVPLPPPSPPAWHSVLSPESARFFWSQPTLEPSLATGNESVVEVALANMNLHPDTPITPEQIDDLFQKSLRRRKGEFALEMASAIEDDLGVVQVPKHVAEMFDWLYSAVGAV